MKTTKIIIMLLVLALGMGQQGYAKKYFGQADDFLTYGVGARALSMGSAYTALADDASSPYWNPAGMDRATSHQAMFMHTAFFEGTSYDYLGLISPFRRMGAVGISILSLRSGGFEKTGIYGDSLGSGSVGTSALFGSYAKSLFGVSVGGSFKVIRQDGLNNSGTGFGLDLAAMEPLGNVSGILKPVSFGLVLGNILKPKVTLKNSPDVYETNLRAGLAVKLLGDRMIASADINKLRNQSAFITEGIEINPWKAISLRFGYNQIPSLTYGLGIKLANWQIDYGLNNHELGFVHKVSLSYSWGNVYKAEADPKSRNGKKNGRWSKSEDILLEGLDNSINFSIKVPKIAVKEWELVVRQPEKILKTFQGFSRPPDTIPWDVHDEYGRPAAPGDYLYEWTVVYEDGQIWKSRGKLKLRAKPAQDDLGIDAIKR